MDTSPDSNDGNMPEEHHIVKADEVDQTGTDISPVSDDQLMEEVVEELRQEQAQEQAAEAMQPVESNDIQPEKKCKRPELRRDNPVAPPPPLQPLRLPRLAQLRRLVQEMPKVEQPAYAFEYADSQAFPEELDEWFQYNDFDRFLLKGMKKTFDRQWSIFCNTQNSGTTEFSWVDSSDDLRRTFLSRSFDKLHYPEISVRIEALEILCYAVTGVWGITAGRSTPDFPENPDPKTAAESPRSKSLQIEWIEKNVLLVQQCDGIPLLVKRLSELFDRTRSSQEADLDGLEFSQGHIGDIPGPDREANLVLTLLYFSIEVGRRQEARDPQCTLIRDALAESDPCLLVTIVEIIARLRWDETANIPLTRIILLLWKSLLLVFGGSSQLKKAKELLEPPASREPVPTNRRGPFLHASPLDYHAFRQEITSKYPAYNPPPPIVPLELENNSILPPFPQHPARGSTNGLFSGVGPSIAGGNGSILQQAVHIATPAPSPPPSPGGPGGKGGKKQNYQTNQNFPLMYPPLDDTSNKIGGKGTTERQDVLVGKRWEGSDVPASIIEAGRLFSTHVKMARSMRQLWQERENFMKYDRGWNLSPEDLRDELDSINLSGPGRSKTKKSTEQTEDSDTQRRLDAVESFYAQTLVHLQSITIVFLKIILTNVSAVVNQANSQTSQNMSNGHGPDGSSADFFAEPSVDELDNIRLREITSKAVSGTLLLLVKWFKRSHVLKFEYMTQLLLDSNYLPLILKMFAHQDVDQTVAQRNDRDELSFFHFCRENTDHPSDIDDPDCGDTESEDEAAPPPISRHRPNLFRADTSVRNISAEETMASLNGPTRPEVDELGYPTAPLPKEPITVFSFRNFFSAINYLHIMQKITRDKAHRCLLLVQYKSSTILRKGLKIPDPHLRFYTLKLFKSQVPYCGRKWRQSNMRVITAIYLYCKPELRDDWLAGSDIENDVEVALPLEQALRGLTHWWHLRQYKGVMGGPEGTAIMEEERDFFVRELESMGWGCTDDLVAEESEMVNPMMNGTEWDGGLQTEGWS
ncbi:hypothetical protein N7454_005389 [Penicillium verhagenii]|nr:hypothetical protein N7454_005389 [Penicillium verhagenii]